MLRLLPPVICLAALLSSPVAARPLEASISAVLSPDLSRLSGAFSFEVRNDAAVPLETLTLLLYPRALSRPPAALNDINYRWIYPGPFEPAGLSLAGLEVTYPDATSAMVGTAADAGSSAPTVDLPLLRPLQPGEVLELSGRFTTDIPKRFGGFGRFREQLALEGGFHPLVVGQSAEGFALEAPLPTYEYRIVLELPDGMPAWIGGQTYAGPMTVRGAAPALRVGSRLSAQRLEVPGAPPVEMIWMPGARARERARLERILFRAIEDLRAAFPALLEPAGPPIHLSQAPLRDILTLPVDGGMWVSDRLFRVMPVFYRFHELELRWRLYQLVLERALRSREGADLPWVAEGLAFQLAARLEPARTRGASLEAMLGKFSAIPLIDRLLHNPTYALGETYARSAHRPDRFSQHLGSHVGPGTDGPVIFSRLEARFGGEALERASTSYLQTGGRGDRWLTLLARETGRPEPVPVAWRERIRRGNYRLEPPEIERTADGAHAVRIDVAREGEAVAEPVTVEVSGRSGPSVGRLCGKGPLYKREQVRGVWDAEGEQGRLELRTRLRPRRVTVDPDRVLIETTRTDNGYPVRYNWIIWDLLFWVSAGRGEGGADGTGEGEIDAFTSMLLNLRYKDTLQERHVWDFKAYRLQESLGGSVGYYHYFGRRRTVYRWEHELRLELGYRQLRGEFELETVRASAPAGLSLDRALTISAGYSFDDRLNPYAPIRGKGLDFYTLVGAGIDGAGGLEPFGAVGLHARKLFPFNEVHGLAGRLKAETFLYGASIPAMNLFLLGGFGEMRSLPARAQGGESKILLSLEERHPLWLEADVNLLLLRLREIRGVAFVDAGAVGARGFRGVRGEDVRLGAGYGLRFIVDLFGLSPLLVTVDAALPIEGAIRAGTLPDRDQLQFYVGSYQAF